MGISSAVVRAAANLSGAGTSQSFTESGFGTPKAAIVIVTEAEADGTAKDDARLSIGLCDMTDALVVGISDDHGVTTMNSQTRSDSVGDAIITNHTGSGSVEWAADFASTTTDGITITWTTQQASNAPLVTVILLGGDDLTAKVVEVGSPPTTQGGRTDVTGVGFEADIVIGLGGTPAFNPTGSTPEANLGFGFATNHGGRINQRGFSLMADDAASTSDNDTIMDPAHILPMCPDSGPGDASLRIESFDSDGFDIVATDAGDDYFGVAFLCLSLGGSKQYALVENRLPSGTGDHAIDNIGFRPGFILGVISPNTFFGPDQDNTAQIGMAICAADHLDASFCNSIASQDAVGTANTQSVSNDQFIDIYSHDGTTGLHGTLSSLDAGGFTVNISSAGGVRYQGFFLCIENETGSDPANSIVAQLDDDDHGSLTIDATFYDPFDGTAALTLSSLTENGTRAALYAKKITSSLATGRYYVDISNNSSGEVYQTIEGDWNQTTQVWTPLNVVSYWLVGSGTTPPTASEIADEVETRWIGPFISETGTTDASGQTTTLVKTNLTPTANLYAGETIVVRDGTDGKYHARRIVSHNALGDFTVSPPLNHAAAASQTCWILPDVAAGFDVWETPKSEFTTADSFGKAVIDTESDVEAILVDTGTTLDGKLDTIDTNVDAILVDTGTTIPAQITSEINDVQADIAALNDPTAAAIADAVLDEALSGHTTAGSLGKAVADIETDVTAILVDTGTTLDGKLDTIDTNVDAILVDTGTTIPAQITSEINDVQTDISNLNDPTAAAIADAVLDEALSGHTTAGSLGKAVADIETDAAAILVDTGTTLDGKLDTIDTNVDAILVDTGTTIPAQITSEINDVQTDIAALNDPTAAAIADAVWDESTTGHTTAGTFGEQVKTDIDAILVDTGTTLPGTLTTIESKIDTVDTVVDAILVDTAEIGVAGAGLTDLGGMSTAMKGEVNAEVDTALTDYDAVVPGDLPANFSDLAITATTGRVTVGTLAADSVSASALAADAVTEIADGVLGATVEGSISVVQALRGTIAVLLGELSGAATTTITIRDASDTKTRVTATVDGDGNRSALTLDLT